MEIIAVILMIVFTLVGASDRKKKIARQSGEQTVSARQTASARQPGKGRPVREMSLIEREQRMNELRQKQAARQARRSAASGGDSVTFDGALNELKDLLSQAVGESHEGESLMADDADCAGGSLPHTHAEGLSALSDEECAGGSMPHEHTQGESRAEQKKRLERLDVGREADAPERLMPRGIDARAMRRAVVMAEVLGKPKGLRKSRFVA